jgi:hypothetical protein
VEALKQAVDSSYPNKHHEYKDEYAVHVCKVVDGVKVYDGLFE